MADLKRRRAAVTNPDSTLIIAVAVIAVAALALLFGFGIWWLWWRLPKWQVDRLTLKILDPKARADVEDNFRKTVGHALGGAAVLIGAAFALFQFLQQQTTLHDLLISNQVSKGFEQLAGDKIAMRLGGIYALEGVMNTSAQYYAPVLEALCAFVRENTIGKTASKDKPATDVQAALTVIGRRTKGPGAVDLANVSIPEANLFDADLRGADLFHTNLERANLGGANLNDAALIRANLERSDLRGASLRSANLRSANLTGANLVRSDLRGAYLSGANLNDADLRGANLRSVDLYGAHLTGANLGLTDLNGADLSDADLSGADLSVADLSGARLTQTQLDEACGDANTKLPKGLTPPKPCPPVHVP
jgi:uncharacterized protein YjbI with pentapeptide repeats